MSDNIGCQSGWTRRIRHMCGIAGFVVDRDRWCNEQKTQIGEQMCAQIVHRGPDDQGIAVVGGAVLGVRRLAIIDLQGGHQPISGEDGSVTVAFNGEIYNYLELQSSLKKLW